MKNCFIFARFFFGREYRASTAEEASSLAYLANSYHHLGKSELAADAYLQALDILERQVLQVSDSEDGKAAYKAQYESMYHDALLAFLTLERTEGAHHILERFRAQSTLKMLGKRRIALVEVPHDLERRRREIDRLYDLSIWHRDKIHRQRDRKALAAILKKQRDLRIQRDHLNNEIRHRFPEIADLGDPQPLNISEIRPVLDPGTLLLSYTVGPEKAILFVLSHESELIVHEIDATEKVLWRQLRHFYETIRSATAPDDKASLSRMGAWLYEKLVAPAAEQIKDSERLLVIADGPLHYLPFTALVRPDGRYLIQEIPVHNAASATIYAQLQKKRQHAPLMSRDHPLRIAAFGNPSYPQAGVQAVKSVRSAIERGLFDGGLETLPYTQHEVQEIAKLFPAASVQTYLQKDATEESARTLSDSFQVVHFAAHAVTDDYTPLDSFVALSIPEQPEDVVAKGDHNGLLQAWEILERVRLNAELVVLSACQTAIGPERSGEGLLSLSRAFLVAGARTVVASLWNVNDASTSELMIRFYTNLRTGISKDEAMREAQLALLGGRIEVEEDGKKVRKDYSSPYYWGAFQVIGDWR